MVVPNLGDPYKEFDIHDAALEKEPHIEDCWGGYIYDGDDYWEINGEYYNLDSLRQWMVDNRRTLDMEEW